MKITEWIKTALANLTRIQHEPILAVGVALEALNVFQQSTAGGLGFEDAAYAAVIAVLTLLGRQLVYPASKIDNSLGVPVVIAEEPKTADEPLGKPYVGETDE